MEIKKLSKNIRLAQYAGFCHGVKRAVDTAKRVKIENPNKKVWVLGELIHNAKVIKELEELGIHTVDNLDNCQSGICIIRSHGMSLNKIKEIQDKGFDVVDLTCPDVKKVQEKAIQLAKSGIPVLIIGQGEHPEVMAIKANAQMYSNKVFVIPNVETLKSVSDIIKSEKKAGVVVQTTQKSELLQSIVSELLLLTNELTVFNTICKSTTLRQKEARNLALISDLMIVAGGKNSANTTHLAEILNNITTTLHIESLDDLRENIEIIKKSNNIGVTAGASTPQTLINEIITELKKI